MATYYWNVTIDFLDGTTETHEWISDVFTREGQLHLLKEGTIGSEHVGSYPLLHVKKWKRTQR